MESKNKKAKLSPKPSRKKSVGELPKKEKRAVLSEAVERLKKVYPESVCALEYDSDPWKLLVMGRLSAQCTDARVNIVCKELFSKAFRLETRIALSMCSSRPLPFLSTRP